MPYKIKFYYFKIDRYKTDKNTEEKAKKFLSILIYSLRYYS